MLFAVCCVSCVVCRLLCVVCRVLCVACCISRKLTKKWSSRTCPGQGTFAMMILGVRCVLCVVCCLVFAVFVCVFCCFSLVFIVFLLVVVCVLYVVCCVSCVVCCELAYVGSKDSPVARIYIYGGVPFVSDIHKYSKTDTSS